MRRVKLIVAAAVAAAAVGVVGPAQPAQAECDPGPMAVSDGTAASSNGCSNTCQRLGAAVAKVVGQSVWECTM